jgi:hypothetical protein
MGTLAALVRHFLPFPLTKEKSVINLLLVCEEDTVLANGQP